MQNFFNDAAERAVKEVETRLRELFRELKQGRDPKDIGDVISGLLSSNGLYHFSDTSTQDGKNFREGFETIVRGYFRAYRNPMAHTNHDMTKQEAFELITLSSMIMRIICMEEH